MLCGKMIFSLVENFVCDRPANHAGECSRASHDCKDCGSSHGVCRWCGTTHGDSHTEGCKWRSSDTRDPDRKSVHIIGGGTIAHARAHFALCAPAYGSTARHLAELCRTHSDKMDVKLHLTRMADPSSQIVTNNDVAELVERLAIDASTKIVFFNAAMVDFYPAVVQPIDDVMQDPPQIYQTMGKYGDRLRTRDGEHALFMFPAPKVVEGVRKTRKDIFLVAFKTTTDASEDQQYAEGLNLLKASSSNLVLANDVITRKNMIITPEEARYHTTTDREEALRSLVEMAYMRSHLTFTRSTVVAGDPVRWDDHRIPYSLRQIVNFCIRSGAYKPFRGATVGHFACKLDETTFLTSRRKTDFNDLARIGLVLVKTDGPDSVIAFGSKPSVGGQSQRIIFSDHPEYDCVVHFHCPRLPESQVPVVSQREYECGSHECGKNTSTGLKKFGNLSAVYLDEHGPNVVFNHSIDPDEAIGFITANFDLSGKTGGYLK